MNIPSALVADLRLLSDALDDSAADVAATLSFLASQAALAVPSYLGLTVVMHRVDEGQLEITTYLQSPDSEPIGTSLRFSVSGGRGVVGGLAAIELIVYATQPGALVDLAADLAWLTGREWDEFRMDQDLAGPQGGGDESLAAHSILNQARGVLMSGGRTLEESDLELDARAASAGISRHLAAVQVLAGISPRDHQPGPAEL